MKYTINYDDEQRQELIERISDVLNETGAYKELHKLHKLVGVKVRQFKCS